MMGIGFLLNPTQKHTHAQNRYKAELYRGIGAFTAFAIDFNTVSVLTSISVLYGWVHTWWFETRMEHIPPTSPIHSEIKSIKKVESMPFFLFTTNLSPPTPNNPPPSKNKQTN
ncbi:MAG: hypothetical protein K0U11_06815 [Gammaproteobacteria bacterium]|nr:hypothetical protein [Gammaproteobacteria bacterium]